MKVESIWNYYVFTLYGDVAWNLHFLLLFAYHVTPRGLESARDL